MSEQDVKNVAEQETKADLASEKKPKQSTDRPVYEKPQLRKYTQIDYVTTYGID